MTLVKIMYSNQGPIILNLDAVRFISIRDEGELYIHFGLKDYISINGTLEDFEDYCISEVPKSNEFTDTDLTKGLEL